jgi:hypothetical protein
VPLSRVSRGAFQPTRPGKGQQILRRGSFLSVSPDKFNPGNFNLVSFNPASFNLARFNLVRFNLANSRPASSRMGNFRMASFRMASFRTARVSCPRVKVRPGKVSFPAYQEEFQQVGQYPGPATTPST